MVAQFIGEARLPRMIESFQSTHEWSTAGTYRASPPAPAISATAPPQAASLRAAYMANFARYVTGMMRMMIRRRRAPDEPVGAMAPRASSQKLVRDFLAFAAANAESAFETCQ
jgi:hypothetical protein